MANPEIGMTCKSIDILLPTCIFHIKNKVEGVTNNCRRQHCKEIFIALSISRYVLRLYRIWIRFTVARARKLGPWILQARNPTARRCRRTLKGAFSPCALRELTSHPFARRTIVRREAGVVQPRKLCRCIDAKMFNRQSRLDCRPSYETALIAAR